MEVNQRGCGSGLCFYLQSIQDCRLRGFDPMWIVEVLVNLGVCVVGGVSNTVYSCPMGRNCHGNEGSRKGKVFL